ARQGPAAGTTVGGLVRALCGGSVLGLARVSAPRPRRSLLAGPSIASRELRPGGLRALRLRGVRCPRRHRSWAADHRRDLPAGSPAGEVRYRLDGELAGGALAASRFSRSRVRGIPSVVPQVQEAPGEASPEETGGTARSTVRRLSDQTGVFGPARGLAERAPEATAGGSPQARPPGGARLP